MNPSASLSSVFITTWRPQSQTQKLPDRSGAAGGGVISRACVMSRARVLQCQEKRVFMPMDMAVIFVQSDDREPMNVNE